MRWSDGVRSVALLEAAKGSLVLLAGCGLLSLLHHDVQRIAERLVAHAHLNPASHYPRIFLDAAGQVTDHRLWLLAGAAAAYALLRFVEAWGLWHTRRWAQWLAALGGGIYLPFELLELWRHADWLSAATLAVNLAIVAFMLWSLLRKTSSA